MGHDYPVAFAQGHSKNHVVADYLQDHGIDCVVPDFALAKTVEERRVFSRKEKDVILPDGSVIEVKSIQQEFTWDRKSFPLPRIIVDTYDGWCEKEVKPIAYVFISQVTGAMLSLNTANRSKWWTERKMDRYRGEEYNFYFAPSNELRSMNALLDFLRVRLGVAA